MIPKLSVVLRKGARAHGQDIYPKVPPLVAKLPTNLLVGEDSKPFWEKLFAAFKEGIDLAHGKSADSGAGNQLTSNKSRIAVGVETRVAVESYFECLLLALTLNKEKRQLCDWLLDEYVSWQHASSRLLMYFL